MSDHDPPTADHPEAKDAEPLPKEQTATAPTPPSADIRTMRPMDDPESLGSSEYYEGTEDSGSSEPPPVQVSDDPD
jgi:hypothetical protein